MPLATSVIQASIVLVDMCKQQQFILLQQSKWIELL